MLRHDVVKIKVIDVYYEVAGAWGQYDAVPMQFSVGAIGFWVGDWFVKGESIYFHSKSNSVHFFILGAYVAYNAEICDFGVLGDFVPVDEKTSVSSLYVPDPLEKISNFICHVLSLF